MLDYTCANDARRSRRSAIFALLSTIVACLTLVEAGNLERFAIGSAWKIAKDAQLQKRNAEQRLANAEAAAQAPSRRGLTASEAAAVFDLINRKTNRHAGTGRYHVVQGTLSAAQQATLSRMLSAPGQQIIDPDIPLASSDQTIGAVLIDNGTLKLRVDRDVPNYAAQYLDSSSFSITIAPDGGVVGRPQSTLPADKVSEARLILANAQKEPDDAGERSSTVESWRQPCLPLKWDWLYYWRLLLSPSGDPLAMASNCIACMR